MDSLVNDAINRLAEVPHYSMETFRDDLIEALCQLTQSSIAYFYATDLSEHYLTLLGYSKRVMESCAVNLKRPVYSIDDMGLWGDAIRERRGIITNDYPHSDAPNKLGLPDGHVPVTRHMNTPVFVNGGIVALVGVGNKPTPYTPADLQNMSDLMAALWQQFEDTLLEAV